MFRINIINKAKLTNNLKTEIMKRTMEFKQNPLTNNWLCYIHGTRYAVYCDNKKSAAKLCNNVNKAFASGELKFDESGTLVKTN